VNAGRTLTAPIEIRRSAFDREAATVAAEAAKSAGVGGTALREAMHNLCAAELHERISMYVSGAIRGHKASSGAPTPDLLAAATDWIDHKSATEARLIAPRLPQPNVASRDTWTADNLDADVKREQDAAHALLDAEWGRLERAWVERILRWVVRAWRALRLALTLKSGN
jgi:hypothetical protein